MACNHSRQYFDAVEDIPGPHRLGNRPAGGHCIVLPKAIDNFAQSSKNWFPSTRPLNANLLLNSTSLFILNIGSKSYFLTELTGYGKTCWSASRLFISFAMHHLPTIALKVSRWESFRHVAESDSRNMRDSGCSRRPSWKR